MNEICRTIQGVNYPAISFIGHTRTSFFCNETGFRQQSMQLFYDTPFRLLVNVGNIVMSSFVLYAFTPETPTFLSQETTGILGNPAHFIGDIL